MFKTKKFVAVVAMCMVALLAFSACGGEKKEASASGGSASGSASASSKNTSSSNALKANPASDFEYDFNEDGESLYIKRFIGKGKQIVFPAEIEGFPVTRIGDGNFNLVPHDEESKLFTTTSISFSGNVMTGTTSYKDNGRVPMKVNRTLESVVIPEGVKTIGVRAFEYCENLKSVKLPSSLFTICRSAFAYTVNLKSIDLPTNAKGIQIQDEAFKESGLEKIVIPESVEKLYYVTDFWLEGGQFKNCKSLKSVVLPDNLKFIAEETFSGCTALTDVNIPAGIERIARYAFINCPLTNLKIPESITSIRFVDKENPPRDKKDNGAFEGTTPPLAVRKRLQDLGYGGKF